MLRFLKQLLWVCCVCVGIEYVPGSDVHGTGGRRDRVLEDERRYGEERVLLPMTLTIC